MTNPPATTGGAYQRCIKTDASAVGLDREHANSSHISGETACTTTPQPATNTWHTTEVYDWRPDNNEVIFTPSASGFSLSASPGDRASIDLSWAGQSDADSYVIYSVSAASLSSPPNLGALLSVNQLDVVPGDVTKYSHGGLDIGETRYYLVRARKEGQPFAMSGVAGATAQTRVRTVTVTVPVPTPPPEREEPPDSPPLFSDGISATRQVLENSPARTAIGEPLTATDPRVSQLSYALEGEHAGLFRVGQHTGQLTLAAGVGLDYETTPQYTVNVVAGNGLGSRKTLPVTVEVVNVPERGSVSISPPGVPGAELTAALTHEDGEPLVPVWQWQRSAGRRTWLDIAGATGPKYTPGALDAGRKLRVLVLYGNPPMDGFPDTGTSLAGAVTPTLAGNPVNLPPPPRTDLPAVAQPYDRNGDGAISIDEALAALDDYFAGKIRWETMMSIIDLYFTTSN